MKLRKGILIGLIIALVMIILSFGSSVNAALATEPKYLGLEQYRTSGYSYKTIDKIMWKITSYDDLDGSSPDKNKTIYCIKAGPGFSSTPKADDDMGNYNPGDSVIKEYNQKFDLKNRNSITGNYGNKILAGERYNSLIWVLEHCYVPENDTDGTYRDTLLTAAGIPNSKITDDEIDITQQLAIWYFTNDDNYKITNGTFAIAVKEKADADYMVIEDKFSDGLRRNNDAMTLFRYLTDGGIANEGVTPTPKNNTNPISIDSTNGEINEQGENYILGPYTLNEEVSNIEYTLSATLKNGQQTIPFKILNDRNTEVQIEDVVGEQFYISVPKTSYVSGLEFKIDVKTYETTLTYWSVANAPAGEQPVVEIKREKTPYSTSIVTPNIPEERLFDLALRKFITAKTTGTNRTEITDRIPQITSTNLSTLNNGKWTVEKPHIKNPLIVEKGDIIEYTIRIYNEGDLHGYATEITDYLPEGLKFVKDSQINKDNGWVESTDGRTITTTILSNRLIEGFDYRKILDYEDVKIECEVVASVTTSDQILKNVAEITDQIDINGNKEDRDSTPNDLTPEQKVDYNPETSTQGWGYQDDDDYEDLKMPGKYFDLALRKFITKIGDTTYNRVPRITGLETLNNGTWTVGKEHTKAPLEVKNGDIVLYTIRIYNEGELNGKATLVTDYLPAGLEFIEDSQINEDNGWSNPSGDGKTIVTNKLAEIVINAFDGETLDYEDVQIECKVVAQNTTKDQYLKNIAEITACTDENGNSVTDRDSTPNDLTPEQKIDYNPETSTQGWGYQDDDDYEDLKMLGKTFDLALRKYISGINEKEEGRSSLILQKIPNVDVTPLKEKTATTAIYKHEKSPLGVGVGNEVVYTIRVYNEGELDGYVTKITDYLPPELEFVNDEFNAGYGWSANGRVITTDITSPNSTNSASRDIIYASREGGVLLKAYDGSDKLDYIDVQIKCKVKQVEKLDTIITNIAEITEFTDSQGNTVIDRDSTADSLTKDNSKQADDIQNDNLPTDIDLPDYKGRKENKSILTDSEYHYKGQQDDDDFDKLILQEFDLALRKFITGVNETPVTNRYPIFTTNKDENGNYIYTHTKEPVEVETTDLVEYTIRIFNEGNIAGYAKEIIDDIPSGLEFVPSEETNVEYRWIMYREIKEGEEIAEEDIKVFNGKNYIQTENEKEAQIIATDYLSKAQEIETGRNNLLGEFDTSTMGIPNSKDVKAVFKVIASNSHEGIITNTAEISEDSDENGRPVIDRDSTPNNNDKKEDDIDVEHIRLRYFDLALRKFITGVNETPVTNRYPVFSINEEGNYIYTHTKQPVAVENGNIITYTLRIYNEGTKKGYAKQVKDDLPEGLEFLPENEINTEYRWVMLDEEGNVTENIEEAVSISTDYLSKAQEDETGRNNLLQAFDKEKMEEPDNRDIKIAFKVTEPNTSDRILINKAQIADDEDKDGNPVIDKDSTPDKWIEGEDDQDIEKVKVKYFDLALRKWVTEAIVIENGKEKVTPTGHHAEDDPEEVVKVEIEKSKINKVIVKFKYSIRVTNEGEIPGYALEVSDYIPEGLKFVPADNKNWKEVDGKIVTNALANTLLQPGESAEVEVLLTWINGNDNMGLKVNTAEISKDKNDSNTPDIDSTPNNKKPGEDDIDDAPVILSTKTGEILNTNYILLGTFSLVILLAGVILIKKYVL